MTHIAIIARARGAETRRKVYEWFMAHPCHTKQDAAKALNLTPDTIGTHARAIRAGWRPDPGEVAE